MGCQSNTHRVLREPNGCQVLIHKSVIKFMINKFQVIQYMKWKVEDSIIKHAPRKSTHIDRVL